MPGKKTRWSKIRKMFYSIFTPNFTLTPSIYGLLLLVVSLAISALLNKFQPAFFRFRGL
jgi:hypothetical protein